MHNTFICPFLKNVKKSGYIGYVSIVTNLIYIYIYIYIYKKSYI